MVDAAQVCLARAGDRIVFAVVAVPCPVDGTRHRLGAGPMRPVRPGEADRYDEIVSTDNPEDDPVASFCLPKDPRPTPGLPDGWRKRLGL